jgi:hypothetical protein
VGSAFEFFGKPATGNAASSSGELPQNPQQQSDLIMKALTAALSGDRRGMPTWNGSIETLRPWLRQLSYWELDNHVPRQRWGIKLLQSFAEGSAPRKMAEALDMPTILSEHGYGTILSEILNKYGPYLEAIGPAAVDNFFFGAERSRHETFSNYIAAKELALQEVEAQLGEKVPPRIAGRILLRGANLSEPQRENLAIKYNALLTFDQIATALRPLDRPEALMGKVNKAYMTSLGDVPQSAHDHAEEVEDGEPGDDLCEDELLEDDEPESDGEGNLTYLMFDPTKEYSEEETKYIWAYNSAYRDVRKELQSRRKGRQFFRPKNSSKGRKSFGNRDFSKGKSKDAKGRDQSNRKPRGTPDELMAKTRCFKCNELGHMSRDCPKRESQSFFVAQGMHGSVNRTYMTVNSKAVSETVEKVSDKGSSVVGHQVVGHRVCSYVNISNSLESSISVYAGVRTESHEAVVDTAAEEAVIGSGSFERLQKALAHFGLQAVPAAGATVSCSGIGGSARIHGVWDVPLGVAKTNGLLRVTVIEDQNSFETPFLLPISYQELVGATIDLDKGIFKLRNGKKTSMKRTPTGHRTISILEFGGPWSLPLELQSDLGLGSSNPFVLEKPIHHKMVQQRPGIAVWVKQGEDTVYMGTLQGPRTTLVHPQEVLPDGTISSLSPTRHTHATFLDQHTLHIQDLWHSSIDRQLPLWSGEVVFEISEARPGIFGDQRPPNQARNPEGAMKLGEDVFQDAMGFDEFAECDPHSLQQKGSSQLRCISQLMQQGHEPHSMLAKPFESRVSQPTFQDASSDHVMDLQRRPRDRPKLREETFPNVQPETLRCVEKNDPDHANQEHVVHYLTNRNAELMLQDQERLAQRVSAKVKGKNQNKVRRGIGRPLTRSTACKTWRFEPSKCPHEEDQLRQRAGGGHHWWTCLACGARWERLESAADVIENAKLNQPKGSASSSQAAQAPMSTTVTVSTSSTVAYPQILPAPRYRPDLSHLELVEQQVTPPGTSIVRTIKAEMMKGKSKGKTGPPKTEETETKLVKVKSELTNSRRRSASAGVRATQERARQRTPSFNGEMTATEAFEIHSSEGESWSPVTTQQNQPMSPAT